MNKKLKRSIQIELLNGDIVKRRFTRDSLRKALDTNRRTYLANAIWGGDWESVVLKEVKTPEGHKQTYTVQGGL